MSEFTVTVVDPSPTFKVDISDPAKTLVTVSEPPPPIQVVKVSEGIRGPRGEAGPKGETGAGEQGPKGDPGVSGFFWVQDDTTTTIPETCENICSGVQQIDGTLIIEGRNTVL